MAVKACTVREIEAVCNMLLEVPVMVTVAVPVVAVLLAVSVTALVLVVLPGLKKAVTPLGSPEAARLTLPLKPFCGVIAIVLVPLVPCVIVKLLGEAAREKFGTGARLTVRAIAVALVKPPEVPVTVTVAVPVVAVLLAVSVNVLVLVVLPGLNKAVTPLGSPEATRLTLPLKPFCGVIAIMLVPLVP